MKCECGNKFDTPFCPECGAAINHPLYDLADHIRRTAAALEKRSVKMQRRSERDRDEEVRTYYARCAQSNANAAEKWRAWGAALRELMKRSQSDTAE